MSSTLSPLHLTAADLNALRKAPKDTGDASDVPTGTCLATAEKVPIRLFQVGMIAPVELQTELEKRFDGSEAEISISINTLHAYSIPVLTHSGMTSPMTGSLEALPAQDGNRQDAVDVT